MDRQLVSVWHSDPAITLTEKADSVAAVEAVVAAAEVAVVAETLVVAVVISVAAKEVVVAHQETKDLEIVDLSVIAEVTEDHAEAAVAAETKAAKNAKAIGFAGIVVTRTLRGVTNVIVVRLRKLMVAPEVVVEALHLAEDLAAGAVVHVAAVIEDLSEAAVVALAEVIEAIEDHAAVVAAAAANSIMTEEEATDQDPTNASVV